MTTPERGLFERIEPYLESLHPNSAWRNRIKAEIEKFQQRLAEAEAKAKIVDAMKAYDEADADAEFEPPHPIFRLAEERDAFMFECVQLRARCGELEEVVADVRWRVNDVRESLLGQFHAMDEFGATSLNLKAVVEMLDKSIATAQPAQEQKAGCDHAHYSYRQHGNRCTCGQTMVDHGL